MKKRNWMSLAVLFVAAIASSGIGAQDSAKQMRYALIQCETGGARESFCEIDTRNGVRLKRDMSGGRCSLGQSWGYDERGIWVANGCAGEFEIGYPSSTGLGGSVYGQQGYGTNQGWGQQGAGYGQIISCRSMGYQPQTCNVDTSRGVRLLNQVSRSACVEGQSWRAERNGITVTDGCGGEFEVGYLQYNQGFTNRYGSNNYGQGAVQYLTCESLDRRQKLCPADLRYSLVKVARQLSKAACVEGQTWGFDERGVWVNGGCRAEFAVSEVPQTNYGQGHGNLVRCESVGNQQQYCNANTRYGVRLVNQLSRTACVQGQNWGSDSRGIWVSGGCRAEFEVATSNNSGHGTGYGQSSTGQLVRCESRNSQQQYCSADTRNGVRLVNQLSSTRCTQGQNWDFDNRGIWVSSGCRAEFEVLSGGANNTYGNSNVLLCESLNAQQQYCAANTRGGVRLVRQVSRTACVQGQTWGYDSRGVWVSGGCRAEFELGTRKY